MGHKFTPLELGPLAGTHWTVLDYRGALDAPRVVRIERGIPRSRYLCRCVCGKECLVLDSSLRSGASRSCGCRRGTGGKCLPPLLLTHGGETLPLAEWARRAGIPKDTLGHRLRLGWDFAQALTEPVRAGRASRRGVRVAKLPAPAAGCETPLP